MGLDVLDLIAEGLNKKIPYGRITTEEDKADQIIKVVWDVTDADRQTRREQASATRLALADSGYECSRDYNERDRTWFYIKVGFGEGELDPVDEAQKAVDTMIRYYKEIQELTSTEEYIVLDGIRVYPSVFKQEFEKLQAIKESIARKSVMLK